MAKLPGGCIVFCLLLFLSPAININGQQLKPDTIFHQPLDIPVLLSATFAELRSNHLHSGIDFRTQGTTGHKVYACEDGFVSRIAVAPGGYGNALYIDHPNGYTTVYAHLDAFNEKIAAYVRQQQYERERFALNLFPDSALLPVKRGEVIALSGNTGSSGGPHLHFEVRDTKTEHVLNPLLFGFGVKDNIAPIMRRLAVYPIGEGSLVNGSANKLILDLEKYGKSYRIAGGKKITITGKVAFGIDTYDQTYGSANRCGPYNISFWTDSVLMFSQTMDRFSFDETRYINSLIDYAYYIRNRVRFNRMFIEPNNQLSVYDRNADRGIISFPDSAEHKALVVVRDLHGNTSRLNFTFGYIPDEPEQTPSPSYLIAESIPGLFIPGYKKDFAYNDKGIKVLIPADALYDDIDFEYSVSPQLKGLYSEVHHIHYDTTPLHKAMTVEIDADSLPVRLQDKALIALIEPNGKRSSVGGTFANGKVTAASRLFGNFAIAVDTVPPRITPVNIKTGANMRGVKNIRFKITDDFSGISTYNGWIDGKWVLFEYDPKNNLLLYTFDADSLTKNSTHTLELKVIDGKGNATEYKAKFTW